DDPAALALAVRDARRAVPDGGVGFGWLAEAHPELKIRLEVSCNDHGALVRQGPFSLAPEAPPAPLGPELPDPLPLNLTLMEVDGRLGLEALYRPDRLDEALVDQVLEAWGAALAELAGLPRRAAPARPLPLTPAQAGMYYHYLAAPGSRAYAQQMAFTLRGPAEAETLGRAWRLTAARHEGLRVRFGRTPAGPVQTVDAAPVHAWTLCDLSALPAAAREAELEALLAAERARPLDLERGPALRAALVRLAPDEHVLVWTFHHILMDGWCIALLLGETLARHAALARHDALVEDRDAGTTPDLPPAPPLAPYLDWLARHDAGADRAFWRAELAGFATPTPIRPRRSGPDAAPDAGPHANLAAAVDAAYDPAEATFALDADRTRALAALAARSGVTAGALLQAAWAVLLARQCDADDVVFGLVTSGREADLGPAADV
ncbi:MAG: condensation domain-containing protein, partial [Desulfovibrionaceae bacterium]